MPWLRLGDDSDSHPIVMRVFGLGPVRRLLQLDAWERTNLVHGYVLRCATNSAGHLTDYFVSRGTAMATGGPNWERWAKDALKAGYWKRAKVDGQDGYEIVSLEEFIHIRLAAQVAHDRKRDADRKNPTLTMAVRARDGDACRYCGLSVNWNDRKGARGGTYDHTEPHMPTTVDNYVVCCRACNAGREKDPAGYQLQPPPLVPLYLPKTLELLAAHGLQPTRPGTQPDPAATPARSAPAADPAPRDPAPSRTPRPRPARPGTQPDPARGSGSGSGQPTDPETGGSGLPGSGRDRDGSGPGTGRGGGSRQRSRRGRRGAR